MVELRIALSALALFAAMVLSALVGRRDSKGIAALVLLSLVWLTFDKDFEGPVLIRFGSSNGLTTADLVGLAGLAYAAFLWRGRRRR